ncbi:MAG: hypothetical protein KAV41_03490 [Candidatus Pacebacteria bacterium]|nr:hypothetical protein [Candidatus Paceibacterota bacterium]
MKAWLVALFNALTAVVNAKKFVRSTRGQQLSVMAIIITCIVVGVGSAIGLVVLAKTEDVFDAMQLSTEANDAFDDTIGTIYTSWPMLGLVVIALIAGAILLSIGIIR